MFNKNIIFGAFGLTVVLNTQAQNLNTIVFPAPQANPANLTVDTYSRAITSVKLQTGFKYGFVSGGATNLLNLSLGSNPNFVGSAYLGSGSSQASYGCNPPSSTTSQVGETNGNFAVSGSGAATYNIPIIISPGTKGVQPSISINYNSQAGLGLLGNGWILGGLSSIHRIDKTPMHGGAYDGIKLTANDAFALDGNRLFILTGTYGLSGATYYAENENFATITSINTVGGGPEKFEIKDKNGNTLKYGDANNSSLAGIGTTTVLSWHLNEVKDEFGNYMTYYYKQLSGELVIDRIEYTGNTGLTPYNKVTFEYIPIAEKTTYYINGVEFRKTQLLKTINALAGNQLVKKYVLDYNWNNGTYLASVKEVDANGNELLPTTFCWGNPSDNSGLQGTQNTLVFSNPSDYTDLSSIAADLDGDGFSDYVCFNTPGGRERVMRNDFKNNIGTGNPIGFTSLYDQIHLDHTVFHLSSSVTDEDHNNNQEVYSVISDHHGFLSGTVNGGPNPTTESYQVFKTVINAGVVSVSPIGSYATANPYQILFSPKQFLYNVTDYSGDGVNDVLKIDPENIDLTVNSITYNHPLTNTKSIVKPYRFNSDGLIDFIILENTTANTVNFEIIGFTGSGFTTLYNGSMSFPLNSIPSSRLINFGFGDTNGDGIDEIIYLTDSRDKMYLCRVTGTGFLPAVQVNAFTPMNGPAQSNIFISVTDIDGDGKEDIAITESLLPPLSTTANRYFTYFSLGDLIVQGGSYTGDWNLSSVEYTEYSAVVTGSQGQVSYSQYVGNKNVTTGNTIGGADLNGDGIIDLTSFTSSQETAILNNIHKIRECINEIKTPLRKKIQIKYGNINSEIYVLTGGTKGSVYNKQSTNTYASPLYNFKTNMYSVRSVSESSGSNYQFSVVRRFIYSDAIHHFMGKGFLGFEKIISFDKANFVGTMDLSSFNTQFYVPLPSESTNGKFISSGTTANGTTNWILDINNLISKNLNNFQVVPRYTKGYFIELTSNTTKDYLNSTQSNTSFAYNLSNSGNLSGKSTLLGWGSTIKTINESYTYVLKNGYYKLSNQTIDQAQAGGSWYKRTVDYNYNDPEGHLTSIVNDQCPGVPTSSILTTTYSHFNIFGSPTKVVISAPNVSPSRVSEVNYDPTGRFVIKKINALLNFEEFTYEPIFGKLVQEKGITGLITRYFYDGLGRLVKTISPNQAENKITYSWDSPANYPYSTIPLGVYSVKTEIEAEKYSKVYYSSNGEVLRNETLDYSGQTVISDTKYNFLSQISTPVGGVMEVTEPHTTSQQKYLISKYDYEPAFFRLSTATTYSTASNNPLSAVNTGIFSQTTYNLPSTDASYVQAFIGSTDQSNRSIVKKANAAGQITEIQNMAPGYQQNSIYVFSSNGKPKNITLTTPTNPGQNIVHSYIYDALGQLEQKTDPSLGTSFYYNNALGEIIQETNPNGQFTYIYDALGRVTTKTGGISGTTTYQYVTSGNGMQLPDKIYGPGSTAEFKYDNFNRMTENKETVLVGNKILKTNYAYDNYGREIQHTYPSGIVTKTQYNSLGYLTAITDNNNQVIWQQVTRDALDRLREYDYGNGINTTHTYDNLNYLTEISHGNGTFHKQTYDNDALTGNLKSRFFQNFVTNTALKETFNFDSQDRLKKSSQIDPSTNSSIQVNNLNFDVLGNITHKDDAGDLKYTNLSKPFTLTQIQNATPNISLNTLSVLYNDFDKVTQISEASTVPKQMDFVYGINNERIKMLYSLGGTNQYTRYYAENYDRQETASGYKEWTYVTSPSGLCAVYFNNNGTTQLNYVLNDNLGSPVLITSNTSSPSIIEEYSFDSWGRRRNPTDWSYTNIPIAQQMIRGYTLHEHLDEFAMINMNGRVYDPVIGRFIQADNKDQAPDNLQNYNRYAYCSNNPLKYIDPSGHYGEDPYAFNAGAYFSYVIPQTTPYYLQNFLDHSDVGTIAMNNVTSSYAAECSQTLNRIASDDLLINEITDKYNTTITNLLSSFENGLREANENFAKFEAKRIASYALLPFLEDGGGGGTPKSSRKGRYMHLTSDLVNVLFDPGADRQVDPELLLYFQQIMAQAYENGIRSVQISSTSNHPSNAKKSLHTIGKAFDMNYVNGIHVSTKNSFAKTMQEIIQRTEGWRENYGPHIIQKMDHGAAIPAPWARKVGKGHYDHIHVSIPR